MIWVKDCMESWWDRDCEIRKGMCPRPRKLKALKRLRDFGRVWARDEDFGPEKKFAVNVRIWDWKLGC